MSRLFRSGACLEGVLLLGVLVLVRIVLSFSLEIEIDGFVPWHRTQVDATEHARLER